jgi:hypothetical protein
MTYTPEPTTPIENVSRGTLFALIALPLGVIAWLILWSIGFIASIVGFGVAWVAVKFYQIGSGGPISRRGAIRITVITIGTLLVAIVAGLVSDTIPTFAAINKVSYVEALVMPSFWQFFQSILSQPGVLPEVLPSILIGLALGALGCFSILRNALRATAAPAAPTAPGVTKPEQIAPKDVPPIPPAA